MEIELAKLFSDRQICAASCSNIHLLTVKTNSDRKNSLNIAQLESEGTKFKVDLEESASVVKKLASETVGTHVHLDTRKGLLFASLRDEKRLVAFPLSNAANAFPASSNFLDTQFEKPLYALVALTQISSKDAGDVVLAVSTAGELCAFCSSGQLGLVHRKSFSSLCLDTVLAISRFSRDYVTVVGKRGSNIVACPLKFSAWQEFPALSVTQFPDIIIPQTPKSVPLSSASSEDSLVLGFALNSSACFILYAGGVVHIIKSPSFIKTIHQGTLQAWYGISNESVPNKSTEFPAPSQVFQLSPGSVRENTTLVSSGDSNTKDVGNVIQLDGGYFAIGYGKYVSIWDGVYMVGHALVPLRSKVQMMMNGRSSGKILIVSDSDVHELRIGDSDALVPLSLGLAIKRKGTCDAIISTTQQTSEVSPMRAQPVTVAAIKATAEANERIESVFKTLVKSEDDEEMSMVRALLSRDATSTAEAVALLTKDFTTRYKKVRRGNYGEASESGLARLPSERLAAASVARCLYEIHFGNAKYVVPLIDMVGTGVVSAEAVLAVLGVSDSWEMGPDNEALSLHSILDPLTKSEDFLNAVEAIIVRVGDLCESDIVRVVQYAGRIKYKHRDEKESQDSLMYLKSTRLLLKCISADVDKSRIVEALGRIPLSDVIMLLEQLEEMLEVEKQLNFSKKAELLAPKSVREGFFSGRSFDEASAKLYRGVADWLDKDIATSRLAGKRGELGGCIDWMCHLIDAHVSTLVLDESGRSLVENLLDTVQQRRREAELVTGLKGLTSHLVGRRAIPSNSDPLYKSNVRKVPQYAALS